MGLIDDCRGRHVYLDTNIFIFAPKGTPEYTRTSRQMFELLACGSSFATTSELVLAVVLPRPSSTERADLASLYE